MPYGFCREADHILNVVPAFAGTTAMDVASACN